MDGKIIQEAEGIVNGSGFVRMSEAQTFRETDTPYTISTDFTPKMVCVTSESNGISGFAIKGQHQSFIQIGNSYIVTSIQWNERSVGIRTVNTGITVVVLG